MKVTLNDSQREAHNRETEYWMCYREQQMASETNGRCGERVWLSPIVTPRPCCELPAGHAGWHKEGMAEWSPEPHRNLIGVELHMHVWRENEEPLDHNEFMNMFVAFIESNGLLCGGTTTQVDLNEVNE